MKKILILLSIFLLCGCSKSNNEIVLNEVDIINIVNTKTYANVSSKGYKYYKPRDFSVLEANDFNEVLLHEGDKYYLNVDINAFSGKAKNDYVVSSDAYYSKRIDFNDGKYLIIEINEGNKGYFYLKMLYNYSCIEVSTKESNINDAIIDSMIILSSIEYNSKVIDNIIASGNLDSRENTYENKKPKKQNDNTNILDVYDYNYGNEEN